MAESGEIVWSLGCDVTIEDFDSSIEEIKVGDISLSGVVSVGELPVDVDSDRVNVMDLDVSFSVDGVHSTIIESQVVPHARIVEIGSYSPEVTNEKRYAASAYSAKKIIDYVAAVEQNVINAEGNIDALNKRVSYLESHGTGSGDSHWYLGNDGKLHTDYDIVVHGNALIDGDTSSGGEGEDNPVGLDEQAVLDLLEREGYVTEDDIAGLIPEVDLSDYYTTTQVDDLLSKKANTNDVYTKTELEPYMSWWDKLMAHITVDENGNVVIDPNLMVVGDVASGDEGEDVVIGGISGVKVNGVTYYDDNGDGIVDLGTISGGGGVSGDYLPLSGGTIDGGFGALSIKRNNAYASAVRFENTSGVLGYIGINDDYNARVWDKNGNDVGILIHSGNIGSQSVASANKVITSSGYELLDLSSDGLLFLGGRTATWTTVIDGTSIHLRTKNYAYGLMVADNGNVLIGTTKDSGAKMTISAPYRSTLPSLGSLSADSDMAIHYDGDSAGYGMYFSVNGYTGASTIQVGRNDGNNSAYNLLLNPLGGNVLIGTEVDSGYKLDVNGTIRVGGIHTANTPQILFAHAGDYFDVNGNFVLGPYSGSWNIFDQLNTNVLFSVERPTGNTTIKGNLVVNGDVASA